MAGIKDRLIQFILRGKDELSPEAKKSAEALESVSQEAARLGQALDDAKGAQGLGKALERTAREVALAQRNLSQAEQQVVDLREALNKEPEAAGLQQSLKDAERAAGRARRQLNALDAELADTEKAAKAAGIDTHNLGAEQQRLAAQVTRAQQALAANNQELKEAQRAHAAAARSAAEHMYRVDAARGALASGAKQVLGFAAAFVGLNAVFDLARRGLDLVRTGIVSMLQTGDQFEGLQTRMNALMGSMAAGEAATAWVKDFARTTPLELTDVTDAFAQLKAYGVDPMNGTLQALVDQNEKLGGGMDRLQGIISAVGQAYAKQKLQTEEILQLVERGVPVWDMLSKVTGKNAADLQELASKGKLGRDVLAALVKEIGNLSAGAAEANMDRLSGIISNLKDQATDFYNRIANAGALEYVKDQLKQLSDRISQMAADGSLDALAKGLSDAFVQGVEKVKEFAFSLGEVDFRRLVDDSAAWFSEFGGKLDQAGRAVTLITAPVRALFNIVTGGIAAIGVASGALFGTSFTVLSQLARLIPQAFGGDAVVSGLERARDFAFGVMRAMASQVAQDGSDIVTTWDSVADAAEGSAERSAAAFRRSSASVRDSLRKTGDEIQAHFRQNITGIENALAAIAFAETTAELDEIKAALARAKLPAEELGEAMAALEQRRGFVAQSVDMTSAADKLAAAVKKLRAEQKQLEAEYRAGSISLEEWQQRHNVAAQEIVKLQSGLSGAKVEVESLSGAIDSINSAQSVQQLELLRVALLEAYRSGRITQEEFAQGTTALSGRMKELKGSASGAAEGVSDLEKKLGDLKSVQAAISSAKTDVDINNIRTALRKLYSDGEIDAGQYNQALKETSERQKELKGAVAEGAKAQRDKTEADKEAIVTSEQLRRESGRRMEEERRAIGEAMEARRKGSEEVQRDMSVVGDFVNGVINRARAPLEQLSAAALETFNRLSGLGTAKVAIDTSSLEQTASSLERVSQELTDVQQAASGPGLSFFSRWQLSTLTQSLRLQEATLGQKLQLQSLMRAYESGSISLGDFVKRAEQARGSMALLDEADLTTLESAIQGAKSQMQQLADSTRNTLDSLQDELDGLEGRQADIERRRFATRQRELQAQLAEATASGDSTAIANSQRAMALLRQVEAVTAQQRQREEQQKRIEAQPATAATPAPAATPAKILRLEVRGRAVDVAVKDDADETKLLGILEEAGLRSL